MAELYVLDTSSLISYYHSIFKVSNRLSENSIKIIEGAFGGYFKISIPSIVFVEIYFKFFKSEEFALKFNYEVYQKIKNHENFEIKAIDEELLENFANLVDDKFKKYKLDNHDKLILSSAMMLECPLLSIDQKIIDYVSKYKVIKQVI